MKENISGGVSKCPAVPLNETTVTLYQSLPELRSSERVILEPWPRQTVLQVPMMKEIAVRRAFTL